MSKKYSKKPLALAIGTTIAASISLTPVVNADQNPFGMTDLSNGYMELAEGGKKMEGSCGEGQCGGAMKEKMEEKKKVESSCGENKCGQGVCGANKKKMDESGDSSDKEESM